MTYRYGVNPVRIEVPPRKPSRQELEALVRLRERALEEARKKLREHYGG